jgi:2',3'-cyclic-nucleotide 2'-phosphodiesterase (5'-nucleotidase family)
MLGGQYKKTTYLNDYRKTHKNLIVVDSGDLLNEHAEIKDSFMPSARLKADLLAKVYKSVGIDAINVGELDLALGVDYLKELEKKFDTPFISANIVDSNNQLVFKPYVIKDMDGFKVGIIGIMGTTSDVSKLMNEIVGSSLSVLDPMETLEARVSELKDKTDFIIVLTHQHIGRNWIIARKIKGVDVVVGGHHKQKLKTPYEANNVFIVQSGEKGQYQGMLEVDIAADGTKTVHNELVKMDDSIPNDPAVKAMIDKFNEDVNKLYTVGSSEKEDTITPKSESCKDCHDEAYEIWSKSKHAKAFQTLIDKGRQFNPDCLTCHTTRFEEAGGFTMEAQQKDLRNVQCESCHGDSAAHMEDPDTLPTTDPGVETCVKCHTEHRCPDFRKDYDKEWEKIKH